MDAIELTTKSGNTYRIIAGRTVMLVNIGTGTPRNFGFSGTLLKKPELGVGLTFTQFSDGSEVRTSPVINMWLM